MRETQTIVAVKPTSANTNKLTKNTLFDKPIQHDKKPKTKVAKNPRIPQRPKLKQINASTFFMTFVFVYKYTVN